MEERGHEFSFHALSLSLVVSSPVSLLTFSSSDLRGFWNRKQYLRSLLLRIDVEVGLLDGSKDVGNVVGQGGHIDFHERGRLLTDRTQLGQTESPVHRVHLNMR